MSQRVGRGVNVRKRERTGDRERDKRRSSRDLDREGAPEGVRSLKYLEGREGWLTDFFFGVEVKRKTGVWKGRRVLSQGDREARGCSLRLHVQDLASA
jgi:hypothetical protein